MVKNLTVPLTPNSSTPSTVSEKSDADGTSFEEALDELSPVHKRKGRQSNWNPQHLLILQAQFASSLRGTAEGKYITSDLDPQERVHISKFTGLSMTTISHSLGIVKYQLRRKGETKFLKNLDTGHPVYFCNGGLPGDLCLWSWPWGWLTSNTSLGKQVGQRTSKTWTIGTPSITAVKVRPSSEKPLECEEDLAAAFQCKLCNRTKKSKHAVKQLCDALSATSQGVHKKYKTVKGKH
uniref:Teashirt 1 n=1 Tax=Mus musculus TaxID=10090 RepID=Q6XBN5_MOUSE|nr:teashirt 1 [Mus musculus]